MKSILVSPKSKKEYDLIVELLKRMNVKISQMTMEQLEDFGMSYLLKDGPSKEKKLTRKELNKYLEEA